MKTYGQLERRVAELESTFGHTHVCGEIREWDKDKCAQCGLDIRDQIHFRLVGP